MGYVIWGHGGLDDLKGNMDTCALETGTTLQFYTDLGQYLLQGEQTSFDFPGDIPQPWPAVDSNGVAPNLYLTPFSPEELSSFTKLNPTWGEHTLLLVGKEIPVEEAILCTGTPATCPTDPRMIAGTREGPRTHGAECKGLLKKYAGKELHWLACTVVMAQERAKAGLTIDADSEWAPYLTLLRDDPDAFAKWFDELPAADIDSVLAEPQILTWHRNRMVTIARGDAPAQVLLGEDPDDPIRNAYAAPGITVAGAIDFLASNPDDFGPWYDSLTDEGREAMLKTPTIAAWQRDRPVAVAPQGPCASLCSRDSMACSLTAPHDGEAHYHEVAHVWDPPADEVVNPDGCDAKCPTSAARGEDATCAHGQNTHDQHQHPRHHSW